jgi:hypothetical protein
MKPGLLALTALLVCGLLVEQALPQAATEAVMTHGLASGAGSSLGKTLGNALGNAATQVGSRLGQQTSTAPTRQRVVPAKTTSSVTPTARAATPITPAGSSSASLIASIQGGVSPTGSGSTNKCSPGTKSATATPATGDASGSPSNEKAAAVAGNCALADGDNSHPAVVNLPPAN